MQAVILASWLILSVCAGLVSRQRHQGFLFGFALSLGLSPVIGLILAYGLAAEPGPLTGNAPKSSGSA